MIVDVIDMSTTLESALDAGAVKVFGASPDFTRAPVKVDPERIGRIAARTALTEGVGVIVVSEPRTGGDEERLQRCQKLMEGLNSEGVIIEAVVPNLGAETPLLTHFENRVVVAVTDTGESPLTPPTRSPIRSLPEPLPGLSGKREPHRLLLPPCAHSP